MTGTSTRQPLDARRPAAALQVLADPTRWTILGLLAGEELCTTHLRDALGLAQPLVSHHLRVLREAELVTTEPCGRWTYYRLAPGALDGVHAALGDLVRAAALPSTRRPC